MNTRIIKFFIAVGLFVVLAGVTVNAQPLKLTANIPFDFVYGDVTMPAGEYDLTRLNFGTPAFRIGDMDHNNVALRIAMGVTNKRIPTETVLIFNRYRENGGEVTNFMAQVWIEGDEDGFEFFKHHAEREAAKRAVTRDTIAIVVKIANRATE